MSDESKRTVDLRRSPREHATAEPVRGDTAVGDRYLPGDEVGRGGMGRVVEAQDTLLRRVVAIKEALHDDPEAVRRFEREMRITARLEHPAIVPVYDAGRSSDGCPYYVMRKVSGEPLAELVARAETLQQRLALLPHVVAAAQAVAHAHSHGIIHRDLKPANILVGTLGETVVIDWGLAKVVGEPDLDSPHARDPGSSLQTQVGQVVGTEGFMPPEQRESAEVDARADVYALGATLYFVLARRTPVESTATNRIEPIARIVSGAPRELAAIVDKALSFDRQARYADAGALAAELQRFLTGQLVASYQYSWLERSARWIRRNRMAFAIASVAFVVIAVGGAVAIRRVLDERDRADEQARLARERQREADAQRVAANERADTLTLEQARGLLERDPTASVALVKPLAGTARWREARDIAASARTRGVAWRLPASPKTPSLMLTSDGRAALATGSDGVVRIHDLERRTTRVLVELGHHAFGTYLDQQRRVALVTKQAVHFIDLASGARRDVELSAPISEFTARLGELCWVDTAHALWCADASEGAPRQIAIAESLTRIAGSLAHDTLLLGGNHLWVWARGQAPRSIATGAVEWIDWSSDGRHAAAHVGDRVLVFDVATQSIARELPRGGFPTVIDGRVHALDASGNLRVEGERSARTSKAESKWVPVLDATIAGAFHDTVVLFTGSLRQTLQAPIAQVRSVLGARGSPYLLGVGDHALLVWDLGDVVPTRIAEPAQTHAWTGPDQVVLYSLGMPARWLDLRRGDSVSIELGAFPLLRTSAVPDLLLVISEQRHGQLLYRDGREPMPIGLVDNGFVIGDRVVVSTKAGEVVSYDPRTHARTVLAARSAAVMGMAIAESSRYFAAYWQGGGFLRRDLVTGAETTTTMPDATGPLDLAPDGTVFVARGSDVIRWPVIGDPEVWATVSQPLVGVKSADADHLVAVGRDGAAYVIDRARKGQVRSVAGPGLVSSATAVRGTLMVVRGATLDADILDVLTGERWTILPSSSHWGGGSLGPDGKRFIATVTDGVYLWDSSLPEDSQQTAAWLATLTNATAERGPRALEWR